MLTSSSDCGSKGHRASNGLHQGADADGGILYEQALARILNAVPSPRVAMVKLSDSLGLVLARPVIAQCDLPRFDNSAVDGYAINFAKRNLSKTFPVVLRVIGESEAGQPFGARVRRGEAVRILTGAQLPQGADAVVMQEHVSRRRGWITIQHRATPGQHIRRRGEDLRKGTRVLEAGTRLRPQEIGLLAALGVARVPVYPRPTVAILTTGNELTSPGRRLKPGQIYESNGSLLQALVRQAEAQAVTLGLARDAIASLTEKVRRGLACDVLLISGGVSVGDKDFVRSVAHRCGVEQVFWRVNIKPGMPLFFGRRGRTLVFGLPGNPVSVFVTFEEFVKPALAHLMGRAWRDGYATPATLAQDLAVSATRRTHFVRVRCHGENGHLRVEPLDGQGSHRLLSLAEADGWIRVASDAGPWLAGTSVLVKLCAF